MLVAGVLPGVNSYNAAISACFNGKQPHEALRVYDKMRTSGVKADISTYRTLVDGLQAAGLEQQADTIYAMAVNVGILQHWATKQRNAGMLDLHDFTTGLVMAAMRSVLRDMVKQHEIIATDSSKQPADGLLTSGYVHDPSKDLHIITGHAQNRANKQGSTLQPVITGMLSKLDIECSINPRNKGELIVASKQLQQYIARQRESTQ